MSVVLLVGETAGLAALVRWAARFARAGRGRLLLVQVEAAAEARVLSPALDAAAEHERPTRLTAALRKLVAQEEGLTACDPDAEPAPGEEAAPQEAGETPGAYVSLTQVFHPRPLHGLLKELARHDPELVIASRPSRLAPGDELRQFQRELARRVPCDLLLLRCGDRRACERILVPCDRSPDTRVALRHGQRLAAATGARLTALLVERPVGFDPSVEQAAARGNLDRIVRRALVDGADEVERRVAIEKNANSAISAVCGEGFDLLLTGAARRRGMDKALFDSVSSELIKGSESPTIGAIRAPFPFHNRFQHAVEQVVRRVVPQLDKDGRVALVERVRSSSAWDFDFVALLGLSTFIAALGLVMDSVAVVIGAMLVAPLMTPLIGAGLAIVHGNRVLGGSALRAVGLGYALAFGLSVAVGLAAAEGPTGQIYARTHPGLLDLGVAFASGLAAAYALSRPGLQAALPGVAISAALVPPIATSGLSLALGRWELLVGAALLFLTNVVAIVLGAALSLRAVGLRSLHAHGSVPGWRQAAFVVVLLLFVVLAVILGRR